MSWSCAHCFSNAWCRENVEPIRRFTALCLSAPQSPWHLPTPFLKICASIRNLMKMNIQTPGEFSEGWWLRRPNVDLTWTQTSAGKCPPHGGDASLHDAIVYVMRDCPHRTCLRRITYTSAAFTNEKVPLVGWEGGVTVWEGKGEGSRRKSTKRGPTAKSKYPQDGRGAEPSRHFRSLFSLTDPVPLSQGDLQVLTPG